MIKIKNTIKNIGKLFTFALLIIPSFAICCLLGSWTFDANGNLVGENLVDQSKGTAQYVDYFGLKLGSILDSSYYNQTITISCYPVRAEETINQVILTTQTEGSGVILSVNDYHFTITYSSTYANSGLMVRTSEGWRTALPYLKSYSYFKWMVNLGTEIKPWEPYGVYYSSQNYYNLQTQYDQALQGTQIDYTNYTIQLVNYPTSDTTSNYNVVQTLTTRDYINDQGFLNIYQITQVSGFGNTWDGVVITSSSYLNTYNYNLLFNGAGSPNLDLGLYYKYYESEKFRKISLQNIVGDSAYYGYFDLINLFGKNSIEENIQDIVYNKFAIHWTNNPGPNDLINIKLNSTDGYNMGYAKGVQDNLINLEELNEAIEEQARELQRKQQEYDTLLDHYNNAQINNPLSSMVVAIADIPLNLFHNMFNFDILGFNIAAFILGIITILLVAYVIKLFVK